MFAAFCLIEFQCLHMHSIVKSLVHHSQVTWTTANVCTYLFYWLFEHSKHKKLRFRSAPHCYLPVCCIMARGIVIINRKVDQWLLWERWNRTFRFLSDYNCWENEYWITNWNIIDYSSITSSIDYFHVYLRDQHAIQRIEIDICILRMWTMMNVI